jgi:hypothetical protein
MYKEETETNKHLSDGKDNAIERDILRVQGY